MQTGSTFQLPQYNWRSKKIIPGKVLTRDSGLAISFTKSRLIVQNWQDKVVHIAHFEEKDKPQ